MTWRCKCNGEIKWQEAEPDVGLSAGYMCQDCGEIPNDEAHMNNPAIDPDEYVPECER